MSKKTSPRKRRQLLKEEKSTTGNVDKLTREVQELLDAMSNPVIDLRPEDLSKRFSSNFLPPAKPVSICPPDDPKVVMAILNDQLPEKWKKQISEIVWR